MVSDRKLNGRKGQVWYLDFMVGVLIFMTVVIIYYQYSGNLTDQSESEWEEMIIDSKSITSSLVSDGAPSNWTDSSVDIIGLTNGDYRINTTKLDYFSNISYINTKGLLRTRFNFHFFIQDANGTIYYEKGVNASNPSFLVQTTRFAIYNSSIMRMVLHLWKA